MKKFAFILMTLTAVVLFSCKDGKSDENKVAESPELIGVNASEPLKETAAKIEEYIQKVDKASSAEEIAALGEEFQQIFSDMDKKYPDFEPSPEEEEAFNKLLERAQQAGQKAGEKMIKDVADRLSK